MRLYTSRYHPASFAAELFRPLPVRQYPTQLLDTAVEKIIQLWKKTRAVAAKHANLQELVQHLNKREGKFRLSGQSL